MEATIHIYTYKEGLLSKLAHDLRLTATRFEISAGGSEVSARCEVASLRVDGSVHDGLLDRTQLSEGDRQKIRDNMLREVLRANEYPEVRFVGHTNSGKRPFTIDGDLTLCGVTRPIALTLVLRDERLVGDVELVPSRWGVKPFRALGGTLRVQDRVRVAIEAGAEWLAQGELNPAVKLTWSPAVRPSVVRSTPNKG